MALPKSWLQNVHGKCAGLSLIVNFQFLFSMSVSQFRKNSNTWLMLKCFSLSWHVYDTLLVVVWLNSQFVPNSLKEGGKEGSMWCLWHEIVYSLFLKHMCQVFEYNSLIQCLKWLFQIHNSFSALSLIS